MAQEKTYTVNRAMHGDGVDYARGDTRKMTEGDAAPLLESGALSLEGEDAVVREPAIVHTFGKEPSAVNQSGYTTPTSEGVIMGKPAAKQVEKPATKAAAKPA